MKAAGGSCIGVASASSCTLSSFHAAAKTRSWGSRSACFVLLPLLCGQKTGVLSPSSSVGMRSFGDELTGSERVPSLVFDDLRSRRRRCSLTVIRLRNSPRVEGALLGSPVGGGVPRD